MLTIIHEQSLKEYLKEIQVHHTSKGRVGAMQHPIELLATYNTNTNSQKKTIPRISCCVLM